MATGVILFLSLSILTQFTSSNSIQIKQNDKHDKKLDQYPINLETFTSNSKQLNNQNFKIINSQEQKLPEYLNLNQKIQQLNLQAQNKPSLPVINRNVGNLAQSFQVAQNAQKEVKILNSQNENKLYISAVQSKHQNAAQIEKHAINSDFKIQQILPKEVCRPYVPTPTQDKVNQAHNHQTFNSPVIEVINTANKDIKQTSIIQQTSGTQSNPQKIVILNNNDKNIEVVQAKPQISSSALNLQNQESIKKEQIHEDFNTETVSKDKTHAKVRKIPVFEVIHDDTPAPVYKVSITVLPHKFGTGGSWSKDSLRDVVKEALIISLNSRSIQLTSSECEGISSEVTLAVTDSLGLTESGTRVTGVQEVGDAKELDPDTTTEATSPVLFPITAEDSGEDQSLYDIPEVQRFNNGDDCESVDGSTFTSSKNIVILNESAAAASSSSQAYAGDSKRELEITKVNSVATSKSSSEKSEEHRKENQKNLVRQINHEEQEIAEREKEIEKSKEQGEEEEEGEDSEEKVC